MKCKWMLIAVSTLLLCGCSVQKNDMEKLRDMEFTVIDEQKLPIELKEYIEEAKTEPFEITYGDEGYLYIAKGYGKKDTSGYSIEVEECFETSNILYVKTVLLGPPKTEKIVEEDTFPYIVLKTEYSEKSVVFE